MVELTANDIADLMNQHRQELLRFLLLKVDCKDTAQDLFQETFIRYAGYNRKSEIENPRAFIFRIATNLATDYLRSRSRQHLQDNDEDRLEQIEAPASSLEHSAISQQRLDLLIDALAELPPKCREVFILLKLKHYSYAQVEQRLGISQTMILKYLNRALSHCRQRLDR
ncbi:RNA polymerase sigma factor [Methylomonas methanica]|uniref:RNA polymerase, sigma-24 subunit, ECF subfamily n=1 Tax=Methylomonas methanica (strain DSM 25384 / MC09) TaxID=857087 RepID=G0A109_METMM|nr:RNA polymerase sigma factor [Methylomonas methanica]AEG01265.1 RNA polymerase, sigma-24 subunit, ECF subfamily [Methylomonas methanica MC09]